MKDISAFKRKKKLSAYDIKRKNSFIHRNKSSENSIWKNITIDNISKKKVWKGSVSNIDNSNIILTPIDAIRIKDLIISIINYYGKINGRIIILSIFSCIFYTFNMLYNFF
jgi:hypothetical protein